jgi:coproporphyrinogen III oxidase
LNPRQVDATPSESAKNLQLDYHTLYFYQVLTLDKGTTAGLLVHDQNDVGTLGSLPRFINRNLLTQWINKTPAPRHKLVRDLIALLPDNNRCEVTTEIKERIAQAMRSHYQDYPL